MQQELKLKSYQKDDKKVKIIQLTDLTFHTNGKRPTKKTSKKIKQSFEGNTPERLYGSLETQKKNSDELSTIEIRSNIIEYIMQDPHMLEYVKAEESKGYKIVIQFPKDGLPVHLGKDAQEFIKSKKGKRILRRLDKEKNRDTM